MIAIPDWANIPGTPPSLRKMRCPFCTELPAKVNAETIHEATAPLASLLELKSLGDPVGVWAHTTAMRSVYRKAGLHASYASTKSLTEVQITS